MQTESYTKENIILGIMIVIIVILLVMNYQKSNQISATASREPFDGQASCPQSSCPVGKQNKLVLYYTEWCPHSLRMKPIWDQFIKQTKFKIPMEAIDCEQKRYLCHDPNICGYPVVILYKTDNTVVKFTGDRTVQSLETFLERNLGHHAH